MNRKQLVPDAVALGIMVCLMLAAAVTITITHQSKPKQAHKTVPLHAMQSSMTTIEYTNYVHSQFANDVKANDITKAVLAAYLQYRNHQLSYSAFQQYTTHAVSQLRKLNPVAAAPAPSGYAAYNRSVRSVIQAEAAGVALLQKAHGIELDAMADQLNVLVVQFHGVADAFPKPNWEGHRA